MSRAGHGGEFRILALEPRHAGGCARVFAECRPEAAWPTARIATLPKTSPTGRARVACDAEGEVVGFACLQPDPDEPGEGRFELELVVASGVRGRGIGRALGEEVLRDLDPSSVRVAVREDQPHAREWVLGLGFRPERSHVFAARDLTDPLPELTPPPQEIRVRSLAECRESDGARVAHERLLELIVDFTRDIPGAGGAAAGATVEELTTRLADPAIDPELYLVASSGEAYVAKSDLRVRDDPSLMDTGSTGVARQWRRRGLAHHLKLANLHEARARGARLVFTANDRENLAMRSINGALGFRPEVEVHTFIRP